MPVRVPRCHTASRGRGVPEGPGQREGPPGSGAPEESLGSGGSRD